MMPINQLSYPETKRKVDDFCKEQFKLVKTKIFFRKINADIANQRIQKDIICKFDMGSTYSKVKHIRCSQYFADAILFPQTVFMERMLSL